MIGIYREAIRVEESSALGRMMFALRVSEARDVLSYTRTGEVIDS